jgi:hypothetical protein
MLSLRFIRCCLLFVAGAGLFIVARAQTAPAGYPDDVPWPVTPEFKIKKGDDPRWAGPDFDDRDWTKTRLRDLPSRDGIYWIRFKVKRRQAVNLVPGEALSSSALVSSLQLTLRKWSAFNPESLRDGFAVSVVASYELFWDGRLIGRNGRPSATPEDEQAGYVDNLFQIPIELTEPGEHTVAIRLSSQGTGFPSATYSLNFVMGNFRDLLVTRTRQALLSVIAFGGALVVSLVAGLGWLAAGRRRSLLLMSALCAAAALMQALQAWRWLFEYPYSWHYPRLVAITLLVGAVGTLLVMFLQEFFAIPRRGWQLAVLAAFLVGSWFSSPVYNSISLIMASCAFTMALALSVWAVVKRRRGARYVFAGMLASLLLLRVSPRDYLESTFLFSFGAPMAGCLVALALQLSDERRAARQAALTAARLEAELLRKQLQPHFVMNTLTALLEVVEHEPKTAVTLIEALAEEFRALARMSGEKLVSLGEELALCRTHLTVMSLRYGAQHVLVTEGTQENAAVPPAVFLTLLENGLTHQRTRRDGAGEENVFRLRAEQRAGDAGVRYEFFSPGAPAVKAENRHGAKREGTGMRYVRARMEESFAGRWTLTDGPVAGGWRTVIELKMEEAR